jgi:uncharacterized protein YciI
MSDNLNSDPATLLARAAKLKLFAVLRHTRDSAGLKERLGAHLRWMIAQERRGKVFLSGPVAAKSSARQLDGLTIVRAETLSEAELFVKHDPFVASGVVDVEVFEWTVNEGGLQLFLTLSDTSVALS